MSALVRLNVLHAWGTQAADEGPAPVVMGLNEYMASERCIGVRCGAQEWTRRGPDTDGTTPREEVAAMVRRAIAEVGTLEPFELLYGPDVTRAHG